MLSLAEQENLFAIIRRCQGRGHAGPLRLASLDEVLEIADRVTVMRDGEKVATRDAAGLSLTSWSS